jgi:hypothetical protein
MPMTRSGLSSLMGYQEGGGVSEFEQMLNNAPAGSPDLASIPDAKKEENKKEKKNKP